MGEKTVVLFKLTENQIFGLLDEVDEQFIALLVGNPLGCIASLSILSFLKCVV